MYRGSKQQQMHASKKNVAMNLQQVFRAKAAKKELKAMQEQKKEKDAAVTVQRVFRGQLARKSLVTGWNPKDLDLSGNDFMINCLSGVVTPYSDKTPTENTIRVINHNHSHFRVVDTTIANTTTDNGLLTRAFLKHQLTALQKGQRAEFTRQAQSKFFLMQRSNIKDRKNGLYQVSENKHLGVQFDDSATDVTHSPSKDTSRKYHDKGDFRKVLIKSLNDTNQVETQINEPVSHDIVAINQLHQKINVSQEGLEKRQKNNRDYSNINDQIEDITKKLSDSSKKAIGKVQAQAIRPSITFIDEFLGDESSILPKNKKALAEISSNSGNDTLESLRKIKTKIDGTDNTDQETLLQTQSELETISSNAKDPIADGVKHCCALLMQYILSKLEENLHTQCKRALQNDHIDPGHYQISKEKSITLDRNESGHIVVTQFTPENETNNIELDIPFADGFLKQGLTNFVTDKRVNLTSTAQESHFKSCRQNVFKKPLKPGVYEFSLDRCISFERPTNGLYENITVNGTRMQHAYPESYLRLEIQSFIETGITAFNKEDLYDHDRATLESICEKIEFGKTTFQLADDKTIELSCANGHVTVHVVSEPHTTDKQDLPFQFFQEQLAQYMDINTSAEIAFTQSVSNEKELTAYSEACKGEFKNQYSRFTSECDQYVKKRTNEHDKHFIFSRYNKASKVAAAKAFKSYLEGWLSEGGANQDLSSLDEHAGPLGQGRLWREVVKPTLDTMEPGKHNYRSFQEWLDAKRAEQTQSDESGLN